MARPGGRSRQQQEQAARTKQLTAKRSIRRRKGRMGVAVATGLVAALALLIWLDPPAPGTEFPSMGNQHIPTIDTPHIPYNSSPPSSGPHVGGLAPWVESHIPIPPELFVHNLEDAGVVLAYACNDCDEVMEGLRGLLGEFEDRRLVLTPYGPIIDPDGREHPAALVAWGRVLYIEEWTEAVADDARTFIRLFEGVDHHVRRAGFHGG